MPDSDLPELWQRRRALGHEVLGKQRLYLDIKYWSYLCDVALGVSSDPALGSVLAAVRSRVQTGSVVCPIEYHTFVELIRQRIPEKRHQTAELVDELSGGVTIVMPPERVFLEVLRFLQASAVGRPFAPAPAEEVWTKIAYLVGHGSLSSNELTRDDLDRLNRLFAERLWTMKLVEVLDMLGPSLASEDRWIEATAAKLNAEKMQARADVRSYKQLYLNEVHGVMDAFAPSLGDTVRYLYDLHRGETGPIAETDAKDAAKHVISLLRLAFDTHDLSLQLPTVHVMATLFAHVQWDAGRKYRANDFADFGHAAAAVSYCSAFATERSLAALIAQAKLDRLYGCAVIVKPEGVLVWLRDNAAPVT